MSKFKEFVPHVASIHHKGKPAFSVFFAMPKKDITVLVKKEPDSSGENYYYSFLIGGSTNKDWKKPLDEERKSHSGFLGLNRKEVINFIIPIDNDGASVDEHAHLHIKEVLGLEASKSKDFIKHNGTIHFPGGAG